MWSCRLSCHSSPMRSSYSVWCWSRSLHRTECLAGQKSRSPKIPKEGVRVVLRLKQYHHAYELPSGFETSTTMHLHILYYMLFIIVFFIITTLEEIQKYLKLHSVILLISLTHLHQYKTHYTRSWHRYVS